MDSVGDADQLTDDTSRRHALTPEARVFLGVGLILTGMLTSGIFQFLSYVLESTRHNSTSPSVQYLVYAAPVGALGLAGAWIAGPARDADELSRAMTGLATATFVVGLLVAAVVAVGVAAAFAVDPSGF